MGNCKQKRVPVWGLAFCCLLAISVRAQRGPDRSPGIPTFSIDTNLVVLHPAVRDPQGGFVSGLRQQDFQVFENGRRQAIRLFQHEDVPVTVGLLVDNSGSMARRRRDVAAAALEFVHASNPQDAMFVINFNEKSDFGLPDTELFSANPAELEAALNGVTAYGRTALYDAIETGIAHVKRSSKDKKVLILISDGGDTCSHHKRNDVLEDAARSNVIIYAIGLLDEQDGDQDPHFLEHLARVTGGQTFLPDETGQTVGICRRIAEDIRRQYTIGYVPANSTLDNKYRRIKVTAHDAQGRRLRVRVRAGYIAAPPSATPTPASQEPLL